MLDVTHATDAPGIEVKEAGLNYWVAVQKDVFPYLAGELKAGAPIRIYYHFAGVARLHQPVYLMIEFDSPIVGM